MGTFIIASLASAGLLAVLGAALVFFHLCGLASESLVKTALQRNGNADQHTGDAPPPATAQFSGLTGQPELADMAEIERIEAILREHDRAAKRPT